jgi:murein DD-endopeptidase MepM/ murein hydrolase activator NlpD
MRVLVKSVIVFGVIAVALGGAWLAAGRASGPALEIRQPQQFVGQATPFLLSVGAPGRRFSQLDVAIEQGGHTFPLFSLDNPGAAHRTDAADDRIEIAGTVGKRDVPTLQSGPARLVVKATRPVLYGLRQVSSEAARDLQVRLERPKVEALSTFHYINQGGAEFVVYRATPADAESGVRVGDHDYPGFRASGAGIKGDDSLRVAFFALLFDQTVDAPISLYARDAAGNEAAAPLDHRAFPKPFGHSRIEIDDRFLDRVVPAIAANTPDLHLSTAPQDLVTSFLRINGELRRIDNAEIAALARRTSPDMLWTEPFQPLGNAKVEAKFADSRTYFYQGREIDHQVHLGFDLAVTSHIPVLAANRGVVVHAGDLGIYGNCIILDHGLGVQSLYAHLSSIDVKIGDRVDKGQPMGHSGMTGLAAGDHLHFTMLVNGQQVNPIEWWDPKWTHDRIFRKLAEAGAHE